MSCPQKPGAAQRRRWKSIAIIAAGSGGCGAEPAAGDVRFLVQQWLDTPEYRAMLLAPRFSHLGFAERVTAKLLSPRSASLDDPRTIKVLGFAGSLRKGSYNRMALRAAEELLPDGMTLAIFDIIPIPPYEDVRQAGVALSAGPPR
jgi:NADPH-dependent FMN reductase